MLTQLIHATSNLVENLTDVETHARAHRVRLDTGPERWEGPSGVLVRERLWALTHELSLLAGKAAQERQALSHCLVAVHAGVRP